jgi:hypothetical protein
MHAWNAFVADDKKRFDNSAYTHGQSTTYRIDHHRLKRGTEQTIVTSIYNRIAIDVASVDIRHVRIDQNGMFKETIESGLNNCLSLSANIDQTARSFVMDLVLTMLDEGCAVAVPVDTNVDITNANSFDIETLRVGKVTAWYPRAVRVEVYNDLEGKRQEITLPKESVAIVENPLYAVMNEPNSTLRRLIHKLALLDMVDEQSGSSKLDLIVQLPYTIKSPTRKAQAEKRRSELESQLQDSKYGVAYIDSTEKITQLNRSLENQLLTQIEYLTKQLYNQLGVTPEIFDGTADDKITLNYHNRTIEPILSAITIEMKRKFLTKTARSQGQSIEFFNDPFSLVPVSEMAELADKFTRNEILSGNELRAIIGYKPVDDPRADELRNKNLNASSEQLEDPVTVNDGSTNEV